MMIIKTPVMKVKSIMFLRIMMTTEMMILPVARFLTWEARTRSPNVKMQYRTLPFFKVEERSWRSSDIAVRRI